MSTERVYSLSGLPPVRLPKNAPVPTKDELMKIINGKKQYESFEETLKQLAFMSPSGDETIDAIAIATFKIFVCLAKISKMSEDILGICEGIFKTITDARDRNISLRPTEVMKIAYAVVKDSRSTPPDTRVKTFRKMAILYSISKELESTLRLDPKKDAQDQIVANTPKNVTNDSLVEAIVSVCYDDMDIHLALAGARANCVELAKDVHKAITAKLE